MELHNENNIDKQDNKRRVNILQHSKSAPLPVQNYDVSLKNGRISNEFTLPEISRNNSATAAKISHYPFNSKHFKPVLDGQRYGFHACSCQCRFPYQQNQYNQRLSALHRTISQPVSPVCEDTRIAENELLPRWTYPPPPCARNGHFFNVNSNHNGFVDSDQMSFDARFNSSPPDPNYEEGLDTVITSDRNSYNVTKSTTEVETKSKTYRNCCVRNRGLLTLVIILVIITLSTLSALVYFVLFGNTANESGNFGNTANASGVTSLMPSPTTFTTTTTKTSTAEIVLNQTLFCGILPESYSNELGTRSSHSYNTELPKNDQRINVTSRIVGGEDANILQYPWQTSTVPLAISQDNQYENTEPQSSTSNSLAITSAYTGSGDVDPGSTTTGFIFPQISIRSRVVGGNDSPREKFPWQVSLWYREVVTCGGSIILDNWIITAAHCTFLKLESSNWKAYFGMTSLLLKGISPSEEREIKLVIQHPRYKQDQTYDYDVSLMQLKKKLPFSKFIQPICLPSSNTILGIGTSCFVSGWGSTDSSGYSPHPDILQHAQIDIIATETCNQSNWLNGMVTQRMLCAGKPQGVRDACQGDSGGPLSCFVSAEGVWVLAGSVSWGVSCGQPRYPGVYSNATYFADWIWKTIGDS